ncbi:MAG: hypothetical protein K0U54_02395, partial [Bacteroidetes bacterium]|nr:hypothetical protein [Bacteroidota bacterium]
CAKNENLWGFSRHTKQSALIYHSGTALIILQDPMVDPFSQIYRNDKHEKNLMRQCMEYSG